ncbi:Bug family tripartite tricarboxylate transporter substrate binding protein [Nocardioides aequoreus]|uniref:Bug family tripartite tricarboxylate transporter substrate binding protein n=1 Tax=Nocardioides aequoreus TaxID=397278 RepID=UPI0004C40E73|nr:tripartite tricarboxylate transporter substrate binding protein [Nocardioides aequoreus]
MKITKTLAAAAATAAVLALSACGGGDSGGGLAGGDYPSEDMDWTIAFGPGGGNDIMARTIVDILQREELYPENIVVENRDGGSGATGWGYLLGQSGSGYGISTTSGSFITTPLQADTGWEPTDFTPVGLMAADNALLITAGDSDWQTYDEWVDYATEKGKVVVGGIGTVNVDFILQQMIADANGYEIDYVPYNDEGQMQTSLLSGAIDSMISNPGSIMGQIEAGQTSALLFTGPERLEALPDVPTGEEEGISDMPSMPRGLILPPDAPEEAQEWWIETMQEVAESEAWQDYLEENFLVEDERWGEDFTTYLDETQTSFEEQLTELGAL